MSEMIERVAEAIRLKSIERGQPVHPVMVRHLAGAAIEAMREPTPSMIDAAGDFHANGEWNASDESCFGGIYSAMIDAA